MGNTPSNLRIYNKLLEVMPQEKFLHGKPFANDRDRDQFIYATITVLSQNGRIDMREEHDFRLLYSRRENDRVVARVVAEKGGIIRAQIEPASDGKDQAEAFLALRKHVELQLDRILRDVPGSSEYKDDDGTTAGPSKNPTTTGVVRSESWRAVPPVPRRPVGAEAQSPRSPGSSGRILLPADAPPAYGNAVKEWKTEESKRG